MSIKSILKNSIMWVGSKIYNNRGSKILYYHDVFKTTNFRALDADIKMGTPLELFKKHIEVIRADGYKIVDDFTNPKGQVAIMFDDGFRGIWECRDYFYKEGICPTVFLPYEFIGRIDLGMLSIDEIMELQEHGFIFQSHTWTHRPLTSVQEKEILHELIDSKKELSILLGKEVDSLCMPLGLFTPRLVEMIKDAGYSKVYSCLPGNYNDAPFGLIARNLVQYASPFEVRMILRGANDIFKNRYLKLQCK